MFLKFKRIWVQAFLASKPASYLLLGNRHEVDKLNTSIYTVWMTEVNKKDGWLIGILYLTKKIKKKDNSSVYGSFTHTLILSMTV